LLYQSLFPDRYFFAFDHLDYGEFRKVPVVSDYQEFKIPRAYEKDIFYMKNQKIYNYTWKDVILKGFWKKRLTALWVHRNVRRYKRRLEELSEPNLNLDEPYVYFPLHLQPEMTTSTLGDQYNDQLLALERLHLETPDDWFIYIKENPIQTEVMRGDWFFERLKALPKVKMAPIQTSTYQLIKHSRFVATITGTAGWEAISGGKNVLVFGRPWYLSLPGVFKYKNGFSLDNLVNNPIDHELLELALSQLMKKTGKGIMDEAYIKIMPDFDSLENGRKIACFLKKVLYGQPAPLKSF
jgi:hypothetical protein